MLGHRLFQRLSRSFPDTFCTLRADLSRPPFDRIDLLHSDRVLQGVDVSDFPALHSLLLDLRPDWILNAVGVIKQRSAAHAAIPSLTINALLPHRLAAWAAEWGGRVIHPSTDCVFSGRTGGYTEDDPSDAEDLYGKSKHLGEMTEYPNALTLRTSIIGRELVEHRSLLDWFLSQRGKRVQGYTQAIYSGVTTLELSKVIERVIREHPTLWGLYQVASAPIPKHDLLGLLREAYGLEIEIEAVEGEACDRSMKGGKFERATGYVAPSWEEMVRELAADPTPYREWLSETWPYSP